MADSASWSEEQIIEEREELMASATEGMPNLRIAHFLKPTVPAIKASSFKLPLLSPKPRWIVEVNFYGWNDPEKKWGKWVDSMVSKHHGIWRKAGIFEAIMLSKYQFHRNTELLFGVTERWCCDTNSFVFPWGEATVTLEDMMILGGLSVLGSPVFSPVTGKEAEAAEKGLRKLHEGLRDHSEWLKYFMDSGRKLEHEAFLSLWLSRFVFPGNAFGKIGEHVFPIAVNLSRGIRIALAPAVLASIYKDLGLLKEMLAMTAEFETKPDDDSYLSFSLWAPLQLVQLWIWERFVILRPKPNFLKSGDPRAARWGNLERSDIGNVRPVINSCGDIFQWRPYCLSVDEWSFPKFYPKKEEWVQIGSIWDEELESFARCLRVGVLVGIDCAETYQPHRVAMQFGLDQDIPAVVPRSVGNLEVAWINYSKPFCKDSRLYLPARLFDSDLSVQYQNWWRQTVTVPVCSFPGVLRGMRTSRVLSRKRTSLRQHNAAKVDTKVVAKDLDVPPGFPPKRKYKSIVKTENPRNSGISRNGNDLDVPPGFPPKPKGETISIFKSETCCNNIQLGTNGNEANVPPEFPARPKDAPILPPKMAWKKAMKEKCNSSPRIPSQKDDSPSIRPEAPAKLHIKEERLEPDDANCVPPKNNTNSQSLSPESFTKKRIKDEDNDSKFIPTSYTLEFNSKLNRNLSSGGMMPTFGGCIQCNSRKATQGLKPSSVS
ncbi:OLC1v1022765C1 [Oldenlandia corymbosa var. corymbosa]|uniref:OLC1v1022765C1 n=1 Tax=Oldenlandia corymbosa var. corymbosa TaxID=529605 RepID=A0AAV1C1E6_OLDCO|nr:OLC1v1022765C1 [Oldenlandia corymbosa var. corymbosa]